MGFIGAFSKLFPSEAWLDAEARGAIQKNRLTVTKNLTWCGEVFQRGLCAATAASFFVETTQN
jgi:hypothetical protein